MTRRRTISCRGLTCTWERDRNKKGWRRGGGGGWIVFIVDAPLGAGGEGGGGERDGG
jgi:hypothetical protein